MNKLKYKILSALGISFLLLSCTNTNSLEVLNSLKLNNSIDTKYQSTSKYVSNSRYVPDEIIVGLKNNNYKKLTAYNLNRVRKIVDNTYLVRVNNKNIFSIIEQLSNDPEVLYAEPNYIYSIPQLEQKAEIEQNITEPKNYPNDPLFSNQYAHKSCSTLEGWAFTLGNSNFSVAVIDTGVDLSHPDLKYKLLQGYDFVAKDNEPLDEQGHGTHVAGIVGAITNNNIGIAGFSPNCKILPVRVLDSYGNGSMDNIAQGIYYAINRGVKVINLSLGGTIYSKTLDEAIKKALNSNITVVAAMGNSGKREAYYPAALPGVIAVGSIDINNKISSFSTYGDWISVCAPGSNILSTLPTYSNPTGVKDYGRLNGTSMATPVVSALASLILSKYPSYTPNSVKSLIQNSAVDLGSKGFDQYYGYGKVNFYNALKN